jgi:hypothetical protein
MQVLVVLSNWSFQATECGFSCGSDVEKVESARALSSRYSLQPFFAEKVIEPSQDGRSK